MTISEPTSNFVASATSTLTASSTGGVASMLAVDGSNTSLAVTNTAGAAVAVLFGTSAALPVGLAGNPSAIIVQPGQTLLLTGAQAAVSAVATYVSISPTYGPGSVTIQRGTVSTLSLFQ